MRTRSETERRWRALLREHSSSGLSLRAFAAQRGVSANTLAYWKYTRARQTPDFEEIRVVPDAALDRRAALLELVLSSGHTVRVPSNFDADALRRLLAALESPC
jgi:hypothetical protein